VGSEEEEGREEFLFSSSSGVDRAVLDVENFRVWVFFSVDRAFPDPETV